MNPLKSILKLICINLFISTSLTSCYYRFSGNCLVTPQMVNCFSENKYKVIQGFQKKDSVGSTDIKQRERDLLNCGVKNFFGGTLDLNTEYPGMTDKQVDQRRNYIYQCMKSKSHVIINTEDCIQKGKSTGLCN